MVKKIVFSMILVACSMNVWAIGGIKLVELGLKAGITTTNADILRPTYGDYKLSADSRVGCQIGIMSRINLAMFHIQPELLYSMNRYRLMTLTSDGGLSKSTVKFNTVEVPILFGVKLLLFRFNAGPVFNISTSSSVGKSQAPAKSATLIKPAISYMLGVGVDIGKMNFDVRYNGQFARPEQSIQVGTMESAEFKTKLNSWAFTVGYMF